VPFFDVVEPYNRYIVRDADGRDEVTVPTGLHRVEVVGDEIHLNGRRLYIRGVLDQGYWPG
jgi:beta-galactosidase/beta-glucuronidase